MKEAVMQRKVLWTVPADARGVGIASARTTRYALRDSDMILARMMRDPNASAKATRQPHGRKATAARLSTAERFGNKFLSTLDRLRLAATDGDLTDSQRTRLMAQIAAGH